MVVSVHQALHGYSDGHRQLASSVQLKPRDVKTMLVLSDISGPGARIDDAGYLTGYPLVDSKFYALARTWAAPEMPRPGCVWTHTILIDFADLAALDNPALLLSMFRRPRTDVSITEYGSSQFVPGAISVQQVRTDAAMFSMQMLAGLYGRPQSRVIAAKPADVDIDQVLMALWAQQWPRLRRAFRFCTLSAADRSIDANIFDLQILPSQDRSVRLRFQDAYDIGEVIAPREAWLDAAVADLAEVDKGGLRSFLRRVGGDVESGREAFAALCRLHLLLNQFSGNPRAIESAILLLEKEMVSDQARSARGIVATAVLHNSEALADEALDFLDANLEFVEAQEISQGGPKLGRELWRRKPDRFAQYLEGSAVQRGVAAGGLKVLTANELITGLAHLPNLAGVALAEKPDVLCNPNFWSRSIAPIDAAFAVLKTSGSLREPALAAMVGARRDDLADRSVMEMGSADVLAVVATLFEAATFDRLSLIPWLKASASDPAILAQHLNGAAAQSWAWLAILARSTSPDAVPNVDGRDPWTVAVKHLGSPPTGDASLLPFFAHMFSRALGYKSAASGELAQLSFEPLYRAAAADMLPDEVWRMFEPRLSWGLNWFNSDRCPRLRSAVTDLFVDRALSPRLFAHIVNDNRLFELIAETMARTGRGRRYLSQVGRLLQDENLAGNSARVKIIDALID